MKTTPAEFSTTGTATNLPSGRRHHIYLALATLQLGAVVTATGMRRALNAREYKDHQLNLTAAFPEPSEEELRLIRHYEASLTEGDGVYAKAQRAPSRGLPALKKRLPLYNHYRKCYRDALRSLATLREKGSGLAYMFDRNPNQSVAELEPEQIPRLSSSKSKFVIKKAIDTRKATERALQLQALHASLAAHPK